jgi:putative phosphoserine phosphatase/1-acylglycerol-3-phosphate O-acyltransferase
VIRNSDSIAGRNSTTINPGTVDVAVLPPVSTADWTVQDLRERIEEIRIAYVKLLADWPYGGARGGSGFRPPRSEQSPAPGTAL